MSGVNAIPANAKRVVCYELPDGSLVRSTKPPGHEPGAILRPLVAMGKTPSDCWSWIGNLLPGGYGKKQHNGRTLLAHRWVWTQLFGPIHDELVIDHICGNRACVNPAHLRVVSQAENSQSGLGAKLTPGDVSEIRMLLADGWRPNAIANRFFVSETTIREIGRHKTWKKKKTKPTQQ